MRQYLDLLERILHEGKEKKDRTGVGTLSLFGAQVRYDLREGFPLLTTKKVYTRGIFHELLWFLKGDTNIRYLVQNNVNIWNEWAYQVYLEQNNLEEKYPRYSEQWREHMGEFIEKIKEDEEFAGKWGDLGPIYGKQWTRWEGKSGEEFNQIQDVVERIKKDPYSRRHIVSGWNVGELQALIHNPNHAPPPCHTLFQFYVNDGELSCQLYQRSADVFLGVPFNIASYSLLTHMVAQVCDLQVGDFVHTMGDAHLYLNHLQQTREQLKRQPEPLPTLQLNPTVRNIFDFTYDDIEILNYHPQAAIKAPIAV